MPAFINRNASAALQISLYRLGITKYLAGKLLVWKFEKTTATFIVYWSDKPITRSLPVLV